MRTSEPAAVCAGEEGVREEEQGTPLRGEEGAGAGAGRERASRGAGAGPGAGEGGGREDDLGCRVG